MGDGMWQEYIQTASITETLEILNLQKENTRIVAGATDLLLEMERGVRKGIHTLVDISRIPGLDYILEDSEGFIHLGPLVTHNHVVSSSLLRKSAFPLVQAAWQVGSPQIRNRGTIAGNLITASPANDTITPLMALGAFVVLQSQAEKRSVALTDFYTGVRKSVLRPDEILVDIFFKAMQPSEKGAYVKMALRQAQAISVVNAAVILKIEKNIIQNAIITLGAVAPTIVHAAEAEQFLAGKAIDKSTLQAAAELAARSARPIDDIRGSANYRKEMVRVACLRALEQVCGFRPVVEIPSEPVLLWGNASIPVEAQSFRMHEGDWIGTNVNGQKLNLQGGQQKTLLRFLRENAELTGTKEGCGEGECGACTVILDGKAVMGCLVPAPRAHGAQITTIEGVAQPGSLHPLQQSFIEAGAVQCGYCTPGFIMSGVALLAEKSHPNEVDIRQAFTGNLCRCTGYYQIIQAVEQAATKGR